MAGSGAAKPQSTAVDPVRTGLLSLVTYLRFIFWRFSSSFAHADEIRARQE